MDILVKNARIVSEGIDINKINDIYIKNGIIEDVAESIQVDDIKTIDAQKNYVLPGLVDMYCKICESGYENKHNVITVSKSAAAGGYTSITSSPNTQPIIDNKTVVEYIHSKARELSKINIFPYASITKGCAGKQIADIGEMILAGVVGISDGGISIESSEILRDVLLYSKMFDIPVINHCQDIALSGKGVVNRGYMSTKLGLEGIPREAEEIIVSRNLILAKYTGAKIHLSHITTRDSVGLIRQAKRNGVNVTCGTCPHYFILSEQAVDYYNTFAKVDPPLRTQDDILAIKEGIKDGTIDVIATGHTPASVDRKNMEFDKAAYGISSLETAFMSSYTKLVNSKDISFNKLVNIMSTKPAQILGLKNKGLIKKGYDADIIIVDCNKDVTVDSSTFFSKAKYSLFDNMVFKGDVIKTIVKGKVI